MLYRVRINGDKVLRIEAASVGDAADIACDEHPAATIIEVLGPAVEQTVQPQRGAHGQKAR